MAGSLIAVLPLALMFLLVQRRFVDPRPVQDDGTDGLLEVLHAYADRYGAPVMLTETCLTGTVDERISWLDASIAAVRAAQQDGLRIVGYTWWPLFDMYEWTYRHSTHPRRDHLLPMSLWDLVVTDNGPLRRRRNPVADRYRHHAAASRAHHTPGSAGT